MKRSISAGMLLASVVLTGCAGGTPDCSDTDTLQVLDRAIEMEVKEYASQTRRGTAEEFMGILDTYEITNIRTLSHDADVDSYQCDARITYLFQERKKSVDFAYRVDTDQADGKVLVEYQKRMLNPIFSYAWGF